MDTCDGAASAESWAAEEFGYANLGDWRRTKRLVHMATSAALFPSGKLSDVFQSSADKQGAYKSVENEYVTSEPISESMGSACAHRCAGAPFVFVAVDGSSLTLTDRAQTKSRPGACLQGQGGGMGGPARGEWIQVANRSGMGVRRVWQRRPYLPMGLRSAFAHAVLGSYRRGTMGGAIPSWWAGTCQTE